VDRTAQVAINEAERLECRVPAGLAIHEGDECIVEADKVLEYGRILTLVDRPDGTPPGEGPVILRRATLQDQARERENTLMSKMARETCLARAEKYELKMRLVRVRYSFDRKVFLVVYTADDRVDFREMVKELSAELRARVEMQQIGVRDQAAIVGGLGPCGRQLCCCTWLREFLSVNVRMAKAQGLSLNPGSISGSCGRLKCCLRYEHDQYRELERFLPRQGSEVEVDGETGCVVNRDILSQRVCVQLNDGRTMECGAADVRERPERTKERGGGS